MLSCLLLTVTESDESELPEEFSDDVTDCDLQDSNMECEPIAKDRQRSLKWKGTKR